ncbi:hypothetical protein ACHHYP_02109 [Achlya hypogyna]|uniref:Uncharacterized protein n=1 Tax=Achlya hypogyna TaxID=1202772 RepID=A0A1V9Z7J1_ACHHY|nr:hypothetical protein ACHHYP_02109 [Achlya hypogyna]
MKTIVADDDVWKSYLLANPAAAKFRHKPFDLYVELSEVCSGIVATGSMSITGDEATDVDACSDAPESADSSTEPPAATPPTSGAPTTATTATAPQTAALAPVTTTVPSSAAPGLGTIKRTVKRPRDDGKNPKIVMAKSIKLLAESNTRVDAVKVAMALFEEHYSNRGFSGTTKLAFFKYLADHTAYVSIFNKATADVRDAMVDAFCTDSQLIGVI